MQAHLLLDARSMMASKTPAGSSAPKSRRRARKGHVSTFRSAELRRKALLPPAPNAARRARFSASEEARAASCPFFRAACSLTRAAFAALSSEAAASAAVRRPPCSTKADSDAARRPPCSEKAASAAERRPPCSEKAARSSPSVASAAARRARHAACPSPSSAGVPDAADGARAAPAASPAIRRRFIAEALRAEGRARRAPVGCREALKMGGRRNTRSEE